MTPTESKHTTESFDKAAFQKQVQQDMEIRRREEERLQKELAEKERI